MSHIYDDDDLFTGYALGGAFAICVAVILTILAGIGGFLWWMTRFL